MKSPDKLYHLIRSLDQTEKRYVSLFLSAFTEKEGHYRILFNFLDSQEEYNEKKVLDHFKGDRLSKHFTKIKSRLYFHILKAMRNYYSAHTTERIIRSQIDDARFLYEKELYSQADETLNKASSLSISTESYSYLRVINQFKMATQNFAKDPDRALFNYIVKSGLKTSEYIQSLSNENEYSMAFSFLSREDQFPRSIRSSKKYISLKQEFISKIESGKPTIFFNETYYLYRAKSVYLIQNKKYDQGVKYLSKAADLFYKNPIQKTERTESLFGVLVNLLSCYLSISKNEKLAEQTLQRLKSLEQYSEKNKNRKFTNILLELDYYYTFGRIKDALKFINDNKQIIDSHEKHIIRKTIVDQLNFYISLTYFMSKQLKEAKKYLAKITRETYKVDGNINDLPTYVLDILIHYEQGDYEFFIDQLIKIKKAIKNKSSIPPFIKIFVNLLSSNINKLDKVIFKEMKSRLLIYEKEVGKKDLEIYRLINYWIKNKADS